MSHLRWVLSRVRKQAIVIVSFEYSPPKSVLFTFKETTVIRSDKCGRWREKLFFMEMELCGGECLYPLCLTAYSDVQKACDNKPFACLLTRLPRLTDWCALGNCALSIRTHRYCAKAEQMLFINIASHPTRHINIAVRECVILCITDSVW
jgi:hypothetical protein